MSDATFHQTKEDIRKPESRTSRANDGKTPANSGVSAMKSVIDSNVNKEELIDRRKANLPLPEDPPVASDWNSANAETVNVGSGRIESAISGENNSALRGPATAGSSVRVDGEEWKTNTQPGPGVGRQGKDNLTDLPKDARAR